MKTLLGFSFLLVISVLFISHAYAQTIYWGVRAGASLSNQSNNSLPTGYSNAIKPGLLIGGEIDIPFGNTWSLCLQALYDQKGTSQHLDSIIFTTEQSPDAMTGSGTSKQNFNYLEIPVLFKVMLGSNAIRPCVFAGPSFGILLNGSQSVNIGTTGSGAKDFVSFDQPIPTSSVKSPDISAVAGIGILMAFSSNAMLIADASYSYGLVNIANTQPGDNTTVKSRDIRLAAGILFPLD